MRVCYIVTFHLCELSYYVCYVNTHSYFKETLRVIISQSSDVWKYCSSGLTLECNLAHFELELKSIVETNLVPPLSMHVLHFIHSVLTVFHIVISVVTVCVFRAVMS